MGKFIIPINKLPPPASDGTHSLRFRITTEDKNSLSQWSTLYSVESFGQQNPDLIDSDVVEIVAGGPFDVVWNPNVITEVNPHGIVDNESQTYDIFIKWNYNAGFNYFGRVLGNRVTIYKPLPATSLRVIGQLPSHPVPNAVIERFKIFDTGVVSI